jgi:hypothetical protein
MPAFHHTIQNKHDVHPIFLNTGRISSIYDHVWAFDCETFLIAPARLAPPMVCLTQDATFPVTSPLLHAKFDRQQIRSIAYGVLCSNTLIVGLNVAYDLAVLANEFPELLPLIFQAYEEDRVIELAAAQQLIDIANGCFRGRYGQDGAWIEYGYGLDDLVLRHFGILLDKENSPRLEYGTLIDVPAARWTSPQAQYALDDARWAKAIWLKIDVPENQNGLVDVFRQSRAAWWLHLMMVWGFAVDGNHVANLKAQMIKERDQLAAKLRAAGLIKYNDKRDTKAAMARMELACAAKGIAVKHTAEGVSLDEEACLDSGDPLLKDYARYTSVVGILNKDVAALEPPARAGVPIQSRFDTLVETGRVACSGGAKKKKKKQSALHTFQLHNVRREPGVRESFVARPGFMLLSSDFVMFELCTWSQVCIKICGFSELAKTLNARRDVHLDLGAQILGISYEEAVAHKSEKRVKDARQMSKPANFGFPGGMGWRAFKAWAKANYQIVLTDQQAMDLHAMWKLRWPEHKPYFNYVGTLVGGGDWGTVMHLGSNRLRAGVPYTVACNSFFQGLAADCAKDAGFRLAHECYVDVESVLYGCRIVNFIHDEFILEVPIERAHECSMRVVAIMEEAGRLWCPDVPPRAEPALMHRWMKAAEPVWCDGRLIAWTPEIGEIRKDKSNTAKILQLWPKLNPQEQRAMLQEGVALAA